MTKLSEKQKATKELNNILAEEGKIQYCMRLYGKRQ